VCILLSAANGVINDDDYDMEHLTIFLRLSFIAQVCTASRRIVTFLIIAPYKYSYLLTYLLTLGHRLIFNIVNNALRHNDKVNDMAKDQDEYITRTCTGMPRTWTMVLIFLTLERIGLRLGLFIHSFIIHFDAV